MDSDPALIARATILTRKYHASSHQHPYFSHLREASNKKALKRLAQSEQMNRRWVKDGEVWDAAGITSGTDLARVCFDKDVGWGREGNCGGGSKPDR